MDHRTKGTTPGLSALVTIRVRTLIFALGMSRQLVRASESIRSRSMDVQHRLRVWGASMLMSSFSSTNPGQMTSLQGALCQALSDQSSTHSYTNTLRSEEPPLRSRTSLGAVLSFGEVRESSKNRQSETTIKTTSKPSLQRVKSESAKNATSETSSSDSPERPLSPWEKSPQKRWQEELSGLETTEGASLNLDSSKIVTFVPVEAPFPKSPTCVESAKGGVMRNVTSADEPLSTSKNVVYLPFSQTPQGKRYLNNPGGPNAAVVTLRDLVATRKSPKSAENVEEGDE